MGKNSKKKKYDLILSSDDEDYKGKKKKKNIEEDDEDDEDGIKERIKIYEFEKKRIRIDPRSQGELIPKENEEEFIFDKKGDYNNLIFGALYKEDVPIYNHNSLKIEALKWKNKIKESKEHNRVFYNGKLIKEGFTEKEYESINSYDFDRYFLFIIKSRYFKRTKNEGSNEKIFKFSDKKIDQNINSDFIKFSENSSKEEYYSNELFMETKEELVYKKNSEYYEKLRGEEANNIELWLKFINHQDAFYEIQKRKNINLIIEKKLSIYEKAIKLNPYSIDLILNYLKDAEEIKDYSYLNTIWKNLLK
jgi:hypothetical protein